ncbi:MAG: hypothetical protein KAT43_04790 [Nanoarchaeota archaeon]|nr:hypothetical protein [Nanoarchaeota archaeon]
MEDDPVLYEPLKILADSLAVGSEKGNRGSLYPVLQSYAEGLPSSDLEAEKIEELRNELMKIQKVLGNLEIGVIGEDGEFSPLEKMQTRVAIHPYGLLDWTVVEKDVGVVMDDFFKTAMMMCSTALQKGCGFGKHQTD